MEGIDEMWMRSEPCWPQAYLMYAGWAQGEERATLGASGPSTGWSQRDTLHAAGPPARLRRLWIR